MLNKTFSNIKSFSFLVVVSLAARLTCCNQLSTSSTNSLWLKLATFKQAVEVVGVAVVEVGILFMSVLLFLLLLLLEIVPLSKCSSLVKSRLQAGFSGVKTAPSLNCIKLRKAVAAASMRAIFLLRPWPKYFWPSTWKNKERGNLLKDFIKYGKILIISIYFFNTPTTYFSKI